MQGCKGRTPSSLSHVSVGLRRRLIDLDAVHAERPLEESRDFPRSSQGIRTHKRVPDTQSSPSKSNLPVTFVAASSNIGGQRSEQREAGGFVPASAVVGDLF